MDLRSYNDLVSFAEFVDQVLAESGLGIADDLDPDEKLIKIRALLISIYAQERQKKLVIGHFRQKTNSVYADGQSLADGLQLVIGIETIYCVKDSSIVSNIRGDKL